MTQLALLGGGFLLLLSALAMPTPMLASIVQLVIVVTISWYAYQWFGDDIAKFINEWNGVHNVQQERPAEYAGEPGVPEYREVDIRKPESDGKTEG
jgi:hypothetical protein